MVELCKCHNTLTFKQAMLGLKDEVIELIEEPSLDELSDVVYCLNRLAGTFTKRPYLKVLPGDGLHITKVKARMLEHNCIRSKRHLKNGKCPSE